MSPKLLDDGKLENERKTKYPIITDGYQTFGNHFETIQELYSQVRNLILEVVFKT